MFQTTVTRSTATGNYSNSSRIDNTTARTTQAKVRQDRATLLEAYSTSLSALPQTTDVDSLLATVATAARTNATGPGSADPGRYYLGQNNATLDMNFLFPHFTDNELKEAQVRLFAYLGRESPYPADGSPGKWRDLLFMTAAIGVEQARRCDKTYTAPGQSMPLYDFSEQKCTLGQYIAQNTRRGRPGWWRLFVEKWIWSTLTQEERERRDANWRDWDGIGYSSRTRTWALIELFYSIYPTPAEARQSQDSHFQGRSREDFAVRSRTAPGTGRGVLKSRGSRGHRGPRGSRGSRGSRGPRGPRGPRGSRGPRGKYL